MASKAGSERFHVFGGIAMTDAILITILQNRLENIAEQMSTVLRKSAYSPNIKERADFSCAIFDGNARLIAQAEAIPVHLGSMGYVAKPVLEKYSGTWKEGDAIIVNSPRGEFGGTHLPDITLLAPLFLDGELKYIVANRAHHADIGGMTPGSLPPNSTEIFQEGLIIPPVRLYIGGEENHDVMNLILENVRTSEERRGDLRAQYASLMLGIRRLKELITSESWDFTTLQKELLDRSEMGTTKRINSLPNGYGIFTDYLDSDGISSEPVKIQCKVTINAGQISFDFTGTDTERVGNVNAPISITTAACAYVLRLITGRDVPTNEGCFRPMNIIAPEGTVVNPSPTVATSSANTETSSRIVDVVMGAVGKIITFPAASQGTMNNVILGGNTGKRWTLYETIGGGTGAMLGRDGTSAIHSHMTNTLNTPIEALELNFPIVIREYGIRKGSGGAGKFKGGDGIVREIEFLEKTTISLQTERRVLHPWGKEGGEPGETGQNTLISSGRETILRGRQSLTANPGDHLRIETPGGGGYGSKS